MVIRPAGINHLREVSSWSPTYPTPSHRPRHSFIWMQLSFSVSFCLIPPLDPPAVTLWSIDTRSSKWILYQLVLLCCRLLFFPLSSSHCSKGLRRWTLSTCGNEQRDLCTSNARGSICIIEIDDNTSSGIGFWPRRAARRGGFGLL